MVTRAEAPVSSDDRFGRWPGDREGLTSRQSEILGLFTQVLSNGEVARRAFVSANTIKSHITSIYKKLDD